MNDITSALASKCAARAVIGCLVALGWVGLAWAQEDPRWYDPTRAWSIDFVTSGWGHAEGLPADGPALLTVPMQPPPDSEVRLCFVEQAFAPRPPDETDTQVRARAAQLDTAQAAAAFPRAQLTEVSVTHAEVDGQSIALVEGMSRGNRFRGRVFMTPFRDRITLSTVSCISTPGMRAEVDGEVDIILNTLRFAE